MSNFAPKFPYAFDENLEFIHISNAIKDGRKYFLDIELKYELILAAGQKVRRHFKSKVSFDSLPESEQHKYCKQVFDIWFKNSVVKFQDEYGKGIVNFPLNDVVKVEEEKRVGKYIADLLVTCDDGQKVVIEIFHTHETEKEKKQYFIDENIPFFEIKTDVILKETAPSDERTIEVYDHNYFTFYKKTQILDVLNKHQIDTSDISIVPEDGPRPDKKSFKVGLVRCWNNNCKEIMPVFSWAYDYAFSIGLTNQDRFSEKILKRDGIPKTIKMKPIASGNPVNYLANTCPSCKRVFHRYKLAEEEIYSLHENFEKTFSAIQTYTNYSLKKMLYRFAETLDLEENPEFKALLLHLKASAKKEEEIQSDIKIKNIAAFMTRH